jgi:hypothetical protein
MAVASLAQDLDVGRAQLQEDRQPDLSAPDGASGGGGDSLMLIMALWAVLAVVLFLMRYVRVKKTCACDSSS